MYTFQTENKHRDDGLSALGMIMLSQNKLWSHLAVIKCDKKVS